MDSNNSLFMDFVYFLIFLLVFSFGLMRLMSSHGIGNNQYSGIVYSFPRRYCMSLQRYHHCSTYLQYTLTGIK